MLRELAFKIPLARRLRKEAEERAGRALIPRRQKDKPLSS
jgi:hypothetical protein